MARKKGKRLKLLKGEKLMYFTILFLMAFIPIMYVYTSNMVTKTNYDVESLKNKIEKQKEENESLSMQKDELASLENIQSIADEYGLSYDNTSILVVK
ncbi:MAG: cell division protein FtsL [Mollicutes bacterium]|nr:cell division protein FtsL [Mollicutes bacterium]